MGKSFYMLDTSVNFGVFKDNYIISCAILTTIFPITHSFSECW